MNARVWLDLARAGNFPSVASNVLAALVLAVPAAMGPRGFPETAPLVLAIVAGWLIYAGGATFNDVFDATFDTKHRPERAIPRGLVSVRAAAIVAALEMAAGSAILAWLGAQVGWVAGLVSAILLYDWLHKRWIGSVVLMAGCRVLLACALATVPAREFTPAFLGWVAVLFAYIVALTLLARWEYRPGAPAAKIGRSVGRLLAFIPLIDAAALAVVGAWWPAMACAAAIPLGRWAQRLVAST